MNKENDSLDFDNLNEKPSDDFDITEPEYGRNYPESESLDIIDLDFDNLNEKPSDNFDITELECGRNYSESDSESESLDIIKYRRFVCMDECKVTPIKVKKPILKK